MATSPSIVVFTLYNRVARLDFAGLHEVFWRLPGTQCVVAFVAGGEIHADDGFIISNVQRLADIPHADLICVPGGFSVIEAMGDAEFVCRVRRLAGGACYVISACSGSLALGAAGLLQGKRAACHWAWRNLLPVFGVTIDKAHAVRDDNLITGDGVIVGINMVLAVMADIADTERVQAVQSGIEYAPAPPLDRDRLEHAAPEILAAMTSRLDYLRADRRDTAQRVAQYF